MSKELSVLDHLESQLPDMLAALRTLVECESPSSDHSALRELARMLGERFSRAGANVDFIPGPDDVDGLLATFDGVDRRLPPALLIGHFDTVWPIGTLKRMPYREDDSRAYGPGVYDMKSGIVMIEFALRAIESLGMRAPRIVQVLLTPDEEIGSRNSRQLIETRARDSQYVLVLEPSLGDGALKTARKGGSQYVVNVSGRAAHAGVEPEKGANAVVELAHQVIAIEELADIEKGTTVSPTVVEGGTVTNVIPEKASLRVDVRAATVVEAERVDCAIRALSLYNPECGLSVAGGINRPPMERSSASAALFERARTIGADLGLDLREGSTGGGSDGNFTAAVGAPTLDGLGAVGGGAHSVDEYIVKRSLVERTALLASLLMSL